MISAYPVPGALLGAPQARTYTYCFAAGTGIDTPSGPRAVEELREGDDILTADGRAVPMLWLGRQPLVKRFRGARAQLVRIAAGALGGGLPRRDLLVTGDHGMVLDGLVINAGALGGGGGIDLVPLSRTPDRQTVYHVETARHEVILAEGAACETFVDYAGRAAFDNYADYLARHGAGWLIPENPLPRISAARQIPWHLRRRIGLGRAS